MLNKLEKTKVTKDDVDFQALKDERDAEERREKRQALAAQQQREKEEAAARKKAEELRSYASLMVESNMRTNQEHIPDEDDFM